MVFREFLPSALSHPASRFHSLLATPYSLLYTSKNQKLPLPAWKSWDGPQPAPAIYNSWSGP
jgi:hypothetical protein